MKEQRIDIEQAVNQERLSISLLKQVISGPSLSAGLKESLENEITERETLLEMAQV